MPSSQSAGKVSRSDTNVPLSPRLQESPGGSPPPNEGNRTRPSDQGKSTSALSGMRGLQAENSPQENGSLAASRLPEMKQRLLHPLTEGLLAHAHFNHDPLHRSSQDKKEGQEPVDAESLLPGHPLQNPPHLGPGKHAGPLSLRRVRRNEERRELFQFLDWSSRMKPKPSCPSLLSPAARWPCDPGPGPPPRR